jgi:hypothetical protein
MKKSKKSKPVSGIENEIMPGPEEEIKLITVVHSRCDLCSVTGATRTCVSCGDAIGQSATYLTLMLASTTHNKVRNVLVRAVEKEGVIAQFCDHFCWLDTKFQMNAKYRFLENFNSNFPSTKCACCYQRIDARQPHYVFDVVDETHHHGKILTNDSYDLALVCVNCGRRIWDKASQ